MAKRKQEKSPQEVVSQHSATQAAIVSDRYEIIYSDSVNVAMRPNMMALTFYMTIPDPATESPKKAIRCAQAVVQIPPEVALQLPTLLINQIASVPGLSADILSLVDDELERLRATVQKKIQELRE